MIRRCLLCLVTVLGAVLLSACTQSGSANSTASTRPVAGIGKTVTIEGGTYTDVTPKELQAMLGQKDFTFVNVHIPYDTNLLSGACINGLDDVGVGDE